MMTRINRVAFPWVSKPKQKMLISHDEIGETLHKGENYWQLLFSQHFTNLCTWESFNWAIVVLEKKGNNKQM